MSTNEILLGVAFLLALALLAIRLDRLRRTRISRGRNPYLEALLHLINDEEDLAYSKLVETVHLDTANIDAYIILGDILRRRSEPERALKVHRNITIRSDLTTRSNVTVLKSLSLDYIALKRWKSAEETLLKLDRLRKSDIWPRMHLLQILEEQGKWKEAFELASMLKDEPEITGERLAGYKVARARPLIEQEAYHKSRIILKEALKQDPSCAEAYLAIGDTYTAEDRIDDAVQWWEKLVENVPDLVTEAFSRLENALYQIGEFSRMADIYSNHLSINPDSTEAAMALAHLLERKGEVSEAIDVLKKHKLHVEETFILDKTIAMLLYRSGNTKEALEVIFGESLLRLSHIDPEIEELLDFTAEEVGMDDEENGADMEVGRQEAV